MQAGDLPKYEETKLSSVKELIDILDRNPSLDFFRGQSDVSWTLVPKISRLFGEGRITHSWKSIENFILNEFQRYAIPHVERVPVNKFEWMILGQHYGLPTRLLDWTANPLKALFFAVNDFSDKCDGSLFACSPTVWIEGCEDVEEIDRSDVLVPILPDMIDVRVITQEARFTLFPHAPDHQPFNPLENTSKHRGAYDLMLKMIIPQDKKSSIRAQLNLLGVSSRTLYPDLPGLCEYVSWKIMQQ